ncbi:nicotinic acid mononucleotide adenyltransferase [Gramella sp. GC03-9]|uniref:Nicotinic acid mononucleotide adenyltransferase n=1 Tax=Christiangramia oceanisediminis TaxID=2920386 RepID=A0A9X2I507_9FLAO|nr:nicotinic acid mononucleotide adenyltransferase [Gramella oceanisediminis]MCP9199502.1 nicotinic acid mononucleotide adenyltransferase [Gramella oceanisediminis]
MKTIKNIILGALFVCGSAAIGQNEAPKPVFEKQGDLIKGTFYYEDGSIRQEGTYKDGKLHGEWVSYDQNGEKTAIATYHQGEKDGKWFFWNGDKLTEVDYDNSVIAAVNSWKSESAIVKN